MPRRCMTRRPPHVYQRRDVPLPPVKHKLRKHDLVKILVETYFDLNWIDRLLPDGRYWVGTPSTGYDVYEQHELRLVHRETKAERRERWLRERGWLNPLKRRGMQKRIRPVGARYRPRLLLP